MKRPRGWSEARRCPWCGDSFTATAYMPNQRYCSHRCSSRAKAIVCTHYAEMGKKGRASQTATQDARWAQKVQGMTPLEAYKLGRRDGQITRYNLQAGRLKRKAAA